MNEEFSGLNKRKFHLLCKERKEYRRTSCQVSIRCWGGLLKHTQAAELWFETSDGQKLLTLSKGKGYKNVGFEIRDLEGKILGSIQMKKRLVGKQHYILEDSEGNELAEVKSGLVIRHDKKLKPIQPSLLKEYSRKSINTNLLCTKEESNIFI